MYARLYSVADVRYDEKGHRQYRKLVDGNPILSRLESEWNEKYLSPIIDFMGIGTNQTIIFNGERPSKTLLIEYSGSGRQAALTPYQKTCHILFGPRLNPRTGSGEGHFRARLPGADKTFDPYDKYQISGSNQFCQTYSLMYLVGRIPYTPPSHTFSDYYKNTEKALKFIKEVLTKYGHKLASPSELKKLKKCLSELLKHPYMCLNVPE